MHVAKKLHASYNIVFTLLLSTMVIDFGGLYEGSENIQFKVDNSINIRFHSSKKDKHIDQQYPVYKSHSLNNSKWFKYGQYKI